MSMEYIYEKAPLIEVIAEIHWALKKLESTPDAKIDPYYDLFKDNFINFAKKKKLTHHQELVPDIVPPELLPHQPRLRLRTGEGCWPLAQLGPGIMTANIVPPYNGWNAFAPFLYNLVDGLFKNYPISEKTLHIQKLHLRYIDGFDKSFGFERYSDTAEKTVGIRCPIPDNFIQQCVKADKQTTYLFEYRFSNTSPDGSLGKIKLAPGRMNNEDALIMEFHCESTFPDNTIIEATKMKKWFEEAHRCLHMQFKTLATQELVTIMGTQKEVA